MGDGSFVKKNKPIFLPKFDSTLILARQNFSEKKLYVIKIQEKFQRKLFDVVVSIEKWFKSYWQIYLRENVLSI